MTHSPSSFDPMKRIEELEAEVKHLREFCTIHSQHISSELEEVGPMQPFTEEEVHQLMHGPRGSYLGDLIDELERQYTGK